MKPWPGLSAVDAETDSPSLAVVGAGWGLLEAGGLRPCTARNRKAFVAGLKEDGILVPSGKPTAVTDGDLTNATHIVAIGCSLPDKARRSGKADAWSDVPDDKGYGPMRDAIVGHVKELLTGSRRADESP